jgi:hypothetical protein
MKTLVQTFAPALIAVVLSSSALTSVAADQNIHQLEIATPIAFNKIVVTGNVKVELVQSNRQSVFIFEDYSKDRTSIVQKGDKLFISSNEITPVNIVVYMKDLQRIDVSNTASVTTRGKFSASVLQVFLRDEANAYVNAEIGSLYTVLKDRSALKLKGSSNDYTLVKGDVAKLRTDQFAALKTTVASNEVQYQLPAYVKQVILKDTIKAGRVIR